MTVKTHRIKTPFCMFCGEASVVELTHEEYVAFDSPLKIQEALPNRPADERELLISGTHPACWEAMFGEEEE